MKILIDESLPRYLKRLLANHDVQTVQDMGWGRSEKWAIIDTSGITV